MSELNVAETSHRPSIGPAREIQGPGRIAESDTSGMVGAVRAWLRQDEGGAGVLNRFAASGLNNWWLPKDVGGRGVPHVDGVLIAEEIATHSAGLAFASSVSGLAGTLIDCWAPDPLRSEVLGSLARTGGYLATAGSEHLAGSELQHTSTQLDDATPGSADVAWLSGEKAFCTNAALAQHVVVIARRAANRRAYVAAVVPANARGLAITRTWRMSGLDDSVTVELRLDRVPVDASALCDGNGLRLLESALNVSRTYIAAIAVGVLRRLIDDLLAYGSGRTLAGSPLLEHPVFGGRLVDAQVAVMSMRHMVLDAARACDEMVAQRPGRPPGALTEVICAKLHCGHSVWERVAALSGAMGGMGYVAGSPIDRALQDARHVGIVEGGEDVLRELVHRRVLLPGARSRQSVLTEGGAA